MEVTYDDKNRMLLTYRRHYISVYGVLILLAIGNLLGLNTSLPEVVVLIFLPLCLILFYFFATYTVTVIFDTARYEILLTRKGLLGKKEMRCALSEVSHVESRKGSFGKYPTSDLQLFLVRKDGTDALVLSPLLSRTVANKKWCSAVGMQIADSLNLPFKEVVSGY